jgi:hypothetical protein
MQGVAMIVALAASAAMAQKVTVSHDRQADFARFKTYKWIDSQHKAQPFVHRALIQDIDAQLEQKGLRRTEGAADLDVVYNLGTDERVMVQGYDYGYAPRMWDGGVATYQAYRDMEGKLVVDLIDANKKDLVWRGVAEDTIPDNHDKGEKLIRKSTEKMFRQYPPKKS